MARIPVTTKAARLQYARSVTSFVDGGEMQLGKTGYLSKGEIGYLPDAAELAKMVGSSNNDAWVPVILPDGSMKFMWAGYLALADESELPVPTTSGMQAYNFVGYNKAGTYILNPNPRDHAYVWGAGLRGVGLNVTDGVGKNFAVTALMKNQHLKVVLNVFPYIFNCGEKSIAGDYMQASRLWLEYVEPFAKQLHDLGFSDRVLWRPINEPNDYQEDAFSAATYLRMIAPSWMRFAWFSFSNGWPLNPDWFKRRQVRDFMKTISNRGDYLAFNEYWSGHLYNNDGPLGDIKYGWWFGRHRLVNHIITNETAPGRKDANPPVKMIITEMGPDYPAGAKRLNASEYVEQGEWALNSLENDSPMVEFGLFFLDGSQGTKWEHQQVPYDLITRIRTR